jgi:outer membrane protein assembly factor BamB
VTVTLRFATLLVLFVSAHTLAAQDWSQWRGPARNATLAAASTPSSWPAAFKEQWRVQVGEGYASPVLADGRLFVHSRTDPREIVTAVDLASGKVIWRQEYDAAFTKNQYAVRMAKGPNATPLVSDGRVFTLGATGLLTAWDAASGTHLWRKDYSAQVETSKLFCGTSASPILAHGLLIVQVGSDVHGGRIAALDPATGQTKWEWQGLGPGYASPALIDVGGTSQLVTMTNGSVVGVNARTGVELWSIPFPDEWHENIVTPLWTGSELIVSGVRQGTQAWRLASVKGRWQPAQIWKNADITMYMSSPVSGDGVIYGLGSKRKGQFVALDQKTGAVKWMTEGREGDHASVLLGPAHVLFLTNTGDLVVARRNPNAFELVKKYDVANAETWALPLFLGNDLVVREAAHLVKLAATN